MMIYDKYKLFQSTLLQEERRDAGYRFRKPYGNFNPRSYKRSDGRSSQKSTGACKDFNPRSYKRSDTDLRLWLFYYLISIHAPTRGATPMGEYYNVICEISIHAPTRGATMISSRDIVEMEISIHAPTRGATVYSPDQWKWRCNFNPRSYKRSDMITRRTLFTFLEFQSTLLQEERLFAERAQEDAERFQSTLLQEERHLR